jgi:hypothetical protein
MDYFVPVHQFEIHFSALLNLPHTAQRVIAPFIPLCKDFRVENEFSANTQYTLIFANYQIFLRNDKLIFRYEGELDLLSEQGSIVQNPFFEIFVRLKDSELFGTVKLKLMFFIFVKPDKEWNVGDVPDEKEKITEAKKVSEKYLNEKNIFGLVDKLTDLSVNLESTEGAETLSMTFGPYFGILDINKRNIVLVTKEMIDRSQTMGDMCELKIIDNDHDNVNFGRYKLLMSKAQEHINRLWQK